MNKKDYMKPYMQGVASEDRILCPMCKDYSTKVYNEGYPEEYLRCACDHIARGNLRSLPRKPFKPTPWQARVKLVCQAAV